MAVNQIEQRKQENPDNIYEVPVKTDIFDRRVVVLVETPLARFEDEIEQEPGTDDHVKRVQTGHTEVKREVKLSMSVQAGNAAFSFDAFSNFFYFVSMFLLGKTAN